MLLALSDKVLKRACCSGGALWWRHGAVLYRKLSVGDKASMVKTFTEDDVTNFAELSGDMNPLHLDKDFMAGTSFREPVVHGVLNLGLISAVMGE